MKLYYSAGSCSTSCHIVLEELGLKYEAIEVDWDNANDPNTALVEKLNPLGTLPIFITDEGKQLDQNLAIQTYLVENAANKGLLGPEGSFERAEAMNWLSFVAADLHKGIGALFGLSSISSDKAVLEPVKKYMVGNANKYISYVESKLDGREYLAGSKFTPADAYAFVVLGWTKYLDIPLKPYPNVEKYMARIAARPAVARVLKSEGLV